MREETLLEDSLLDCNQSRIDMVQQLRKVMQRNEKIKNKALQRAAQGVAKSIWEKASESVRRILNEDNGV